MTVPFKLQNREIPSWLAWMAVATLVPLIGSFTVAPTARADRADRAVVERVIDGDTLDVSLGGEIVRVRILNIDTPETKNPHKAVECLGPEASDFLRALLPAGSTVSLRYDVERTDRYGRTLASVVTAGGLLVSTEIAKAGLGRAVKFGDNTRHFADVRAGQQQAQREHRGLFGSDIKCTVPAKIEDLRTRQSGIAIAEAGGGSSQELESLTGRAAALLVSLAAFQKLADSHHPKLAWAILSKATRSEFAREITRMTRDVSWRYDLLNIGTVAAAAREAAAREAAARAAEAAAAKAKAEATAKATADAAAKAKAKKLTAEAEAKRRADEAQAPVAAPKPLPPKPAPAPAPAPAPPASGGYDGYTGCRAYGPKGTSFDEIGRRYTKIPCP